MTLLVHDTNQDRAHAFGRAAEALGREVGEPDASTADL